MMISLAEALDKIKKFKIDYSELVFAKDIDEKAIELKKELSSIKATTEQNHQIDLAIKEKEKEILQRMIAQKTN